MLALEINNVKKFMTDLLLSDTYDKFLVSEISISTFNTFHINGSINKNYFKDDNTSFSKNEFSVWSQLKPFCHSIIKGNHTPVQMKIVLLLSPDMCSSLTNKAGTSISPEQINSLCMVFKFENENLSCVTGTNLNVFTLDKSLENFWDKYVSDFLTKQYDANEK